MKKYYVAAFITAMLIIFAVIIGSISKNTSNKFWDYISNVFSGNRTQNRRYEAQLPVQRNTSPQNNNNELRQRESNDYNSKKVKYIAIILDDAGITNNYRILKYNKILNISVLPNMRFTKKWVRRINNSHHELLLHIPMAAYSNKYSGIRPGMTERTIYALLKKWFRSVKNAKGANNHQGSYATSNTSLMKKFFEVYKKFNIYFVDSVTIAASKAYKIALRNKISVLKRHFFIDNRASEGYIKRQLMYTVRTANKIGYSIAIGHVTTKKMLKVLKQMSKVFNRNKIKLVKVSQLIKILNKRRSIP